MAYELYTIKQFEQALFKGDRTVISEQDFEIVYTEYIDTAGLYETEEFSKVSYISYLNNRINSVRLAIRLQSEFLEEFGVPFIKELGFFKKFGHKLTWKKDLGDIERIHDFYAQMKKVQDRENKYISQLELKIKELKEFREKKNKNQAKVDQSRASWVKTINSLRKIGWQIDKDKDTVEDLAYIIKQQSEETKTK